MILQEAISAVLMLVGALLMLIGAIGILRLPDLYMRVSASTKASTLGVGFTLLSLAIHFNELGITSRALATIGFVIITAPVAAHLISRAAYMVGAPLWKGTIVDELQDRFDPKTNIIESSPPEPL